MAMGVPVAVTKVVMMVVVRNHSRMLYYNISGVY